jgi:ABC-type multidrug transport system ATPase subunit
MPQTGGLYMDLSLKDNLSFYADLYDIREHRFTENRHIKKLGLLPFFNKRISELSGGFQRLAAFTAVLSVAPKMLFLDEPFSGIDQSKKELMVSILDELLEDIDLFVITSPNEKKFRLADRILELDKGHIL